MQGQDILDTIHATSNQGVAALGAPERFQSLGQNLVMKHENLLLVLRGSLCLEALGQLASLFGGPGCTKREKTMKL